METDGYTTLKVGVAGENKSKKCWKVLTIAGIILGISALVVSLSALTLVILQMQVSKNSHILHEREINDTTLPLKTQEEEMKQVSKLLFETEVKKNRNTRQAGCTSSFDSTLSVKPTAHITARGRGNKIFNFTDTKIEIISAGWSCSTFRKGHTLGGMSYNTKTGFLKVPVEGIYFIYSQVLVQVQEPVSIQTYPEPVKMGHRTVICKCENEEMLDDSCSCFSSEEDQHVMNDVRSYPYMESYSHFNGIGGSNYHGGLFKLTANSYISIIPHFPEMNTPRTTITVEYIKSFFGGFFVSPLSPVPPTQCECNFTNNVFTNNNSTNVTSTYNDSTNVTSTYNNSTNGTSTNDTLH